MNTIFNITRAFIFLVLASFASTAISVTVNSASGGASINGAWTFPGCSFDSGEYDDRDYQEFLVYGESTLEVKIVQYASDDESCSSGITNIFTEETVPFTVDGEVEIQGWLGEDEDGNQVPVPPPPRQDGNGSLPAGSLSDDAFNASIEIFEGDEVGYLYIDDTDLIWYLYRDGGEDDTPIPFLDTNEPLIKTELPVGVIPIPAGIWLFGTAIIGFVGYSRRRKIG